MKHLKIFTFLLLAFTFSLNAQNNVIDEVIWIIGDDAILTFAGTDELLLWTLRLFIFFETELFAWLLEFTDRPFGHLLFTLRSLGSNQLVFKLPV